MKKFRIILTALLVIAMLLPCLPVVAAEADASEEIVATGEWYNGGEGVDGQFVINTAGDLKYFMSLKDDFEGKTVYLGADIDWNDVDSSEELMALENPNVWTPYGYASSVYYPTFFKGTFDGQGHSINGLYMETNNKTYVGFFARTSGATVKNVSFVNGYLKTTNSDAEIIGFVEGYAASKTNFENVSVAAYQVHNSTNVESRIGGMVGYLASAATSNFTNCVVSGTVEAKGAQVVGGIVGANTVIASDSGVVSGTLNMTDCINYARVSCKLEGAGLVGRVAGNATLRRCTSLGKVTAATTKDSEGTDWKISVASLIYARYKVFDDATAVAPTNSYQTDRDIYLYDCYHVSSSTNYPVAVHYLATDRDFSVVVYNNGASSTTVPCRGNNVRTNNYMDAATIRDDRMTNAGQVFTFDKATTDVVSVAGIQTRAAVDNGDTVDVDESKTTVDARILASVKFNDDLNMDNIVEIGFEARIWSAYAEDANRALVSQGCPAVYTSVIGGGEEVSAESFEADYLAPLLLANCPTGADTADTVADDINSVIFRSYCKDADGNVYYSAYVIYTFIGNKVVAGVQV